MLTLYTSTLSANGRKALAGAISLGLDTDVREVNVYQGEGQSPEYLGINPLGKIPTLVDEEFALTESNAILVYLSEAHGDFSLYSRDPKQRASINRWLFWEGSEWQPVLTSILAPIVGHTLRPDVVPLPERSPDWNEPTVRPLVAQLETTLGERRFLAGSTLSLADLSVAAMTTYFKVGGFPFADHPSIAQWHRRIVSLPAWRDTATQPWE